MSINVHRILSAVFILALLQACSLAPNRQNGDQPGTVPAAPFVAETNGPAGFSATLSAPDIVLLTWEPAADAEGYKVQIVFAGLDPLTIAYLPADATRFEHLLAPEASLLTYRLQSITASGPAGASSLQITTRMHASNPLAVQAAFSETGVASATIGPAGGTLETVDERGVTYTLVIPPGAIGTDLAIRMTPVSTIDGWPLDGDMLGAVRLEPEGWLLDEVAVLTIRPPGASTPGLSTVGFAFDGSGDEFHLTPAYAGLSPLADTGTGARRRASPVRQGDAGGINLPVMELGSSGAGEASADAAAAMASENAPTDSRDAADQKAAATEVELDDLAPLLSNAELAEIATNNLLTQILNDVTDCYEFKRAVGAFQAWEGRVAELGDTSAARETIVEQLAQKAVETLETAGEECRQAEPGVVPASIPCAEKLTRDIQSGSSPFYTELQNAITQNTELKDRFSAADDASDQCPHSFGVNEAASFGYRWTAGCIPSLSRPYQAAWIGPGIEGIYRLYPNTNDPFSGRVEGQATLAMGGVSTTIVYDGTYRIEILTEDLRGNPLTMDEFLTFEQTITSCVEGYCNTTVEPGEHQIPLQIRDQRCPLP